MRACRTWIAPCYYCRWWFPLGRLTFEHLVNRRDGGSNGLSNQALACYRCNQRRQIMENEREHPYGGLDRTKRKRIEAWGGVRILYLRLPLCEGPPAFRSICPSTRDLKAAVAVRPVPFRPSRPLMPRPFITLDEFLGQAPLDREKLTLAVPPP